MNTSEEFMSNVSVSDGCWEWTAGRGKFGYGSLWWQGDYGKAHRVAWELFRGPVPVGLFVLHRCDNPPCVNPEHLFLGTQKDNMLDCYNKGRHYHLGSRDIQQGEQNNNSKLTGEKVREIRMLYGSGGWTLRGLGKAYGVSYGTIDDAIRRKTWAFVD
jgi:HNH endonuclease